MDPTQRFSDRVENYVNFRPHYPDALIRFLLERLPLAATIADIGSGTGILSAQLLGAGFQVLGVEPNGPMRQEAERSLGEHPAFRSVVGTAESTTLASSSVGAVTCAQSFHWFDRRRCRAEFERILQAPKLVLLVWNERIFEGPMVEYDRILKESAAEYSTIGRRNITEADIAEFFTPDRFDLVSFPHSQRLDREAFIGRVLSSSYVPNIGQPGHDALIDKLGKFFESHSQAGRLEFPYQTRVYAAELGRLRSPLATI